MRTPCKTKINNHSKRRFENKTICSILVFKPSKRTESLLRFVHLDIWKLYPQFYLPTFPNTCLCHKVFSLLSQVKKKNNVVTTNKSLLRACVLYFLFLVKQFKEPLLEKVFKQILMS